MKTNNNIDFDNIVTVVSRKTGVSAERIRMHDRHKDVVNSRMMVYYLAHKLCGISKLAIGKKLNRTHATIIYGIKQVNLWIDPSAPRDIYAKRNCSTLTEIIKQLEH